MNADVWKGANTDSNFLIVRLCKFTTNMPTDYDNLASVVEIHELFVDNLTILELHTLASALACVIISVTSLVHMYSFSLASLMVLTSFI